MTDKQIIIDVTQCPYYKEDKTCTYLPYKTKCEGDCNWTAYKEMEEKLKDKEQECEELKDKLNCCFCNPHIELNDTDKQRKCIEVTECFRRQLDQLKSENKHLNDLLNQALKELEKTRKTLTEIKEIAKNGCYDDCGMPLDELSIILQKISECEVE